MAPTFAKLIIPTVHLQTTSTAVKSGQTRLPDWAALAIAVRQHLPMTTGHVIVLDSRDQIIGYAPVEGWLTRELLRPVLACCDVAYSVVIVRQEDRGATGAVYLHADQERAEEANKVLRKCGIELTDYLIVGDSQYISLKETGRL
jgi:hypothetical protein